ncbi:hypothetical protein DL93DRAFT_2169489 [Clavulina sp. PMI_390]|nr:hypothetical protein DL93DRAFT_2169489 [Clavulina sp. PMI_390]
MSPPKFEEVVVTLPRTLYSHLFGILASSVLFGIITVQTFRYYNKFPRDMLSTRFVVGLLWFMQALEIGIASHGIYDVLITSQTNIEVLVIEPWYRSYFGTHTTVSAVIVQLFFLWRYWSVSRNLPITILLTLLVAFTLGFAIFLVVRSYQFSDSALTTLEAEVWASTLWLSFSAVADAMLAIALAVEMRKQPEREPSNLLRTDSLLNQLALYGVATGAVTASAVIAELFLCSVVHIYEGLILIGLPLGSLYIATFLANLHTRSYLRATGGLESLELTSTAITPQRLQQTTDIIVSSIMVLKHDD